MNFFTENTARGEDRPSNQFQVFIDSDAFVGWLLEGDAHHQEATKIFQWLEQQGKILTTSSLVVAETATVLSYREGQPLATKFLEIIGRGNIPVIHVDEDLQGEAYTIFKTQTQKRTSMIDCANVAVMRRFEIPIIFSFDQVYPKKFGLKLASS